MNIKTLVMATVSSVIALLVPVALHAQSRTVQIGQSLWQPVDEHRLEQMRGGYALPSGMVVAFGIERTVQVNGELVLASKIAIADLGRLTPEQARALADVNHTQVVQIGAGNDAATQSGAGLVVQNTMDNQHIQALTRIDVAVDTLAQLQALHASAVLHDMQLHTGGQP